MPSQADRIADMNTVKGFLVPIYSNDPHQPEMHALHPRDMAKVQAGYACPKCLADFGEFYRITCPMCLHQRDVNRDFAEAPKLWQEHLDEKMNGPVTATRRPSIDDALDRIMKDPNVEHGTMKQLMPRKWGRGRPK